MEVSWLNQYLGQLFGYGFERLSGQDRNANCLAPLAQAPACAAHVSPIPPMDERNEAPTKSIAWKVQGHLGMNPSATRTESFGDYQ